MSPSVMEILRASREGRVAHSGHPEYEQVPGLGVELNEHVRWVSRRGINRSIHQEQQKPAFPPLEKGIHVRWNSKEDSMGKTLE